MITVWLDYAKAFDSVSHSWLFMALRLAKVPENIVVLIEKISKLWATIVTFKGTNQTVKTDIITYFKGIFQGDSLSVILFILSVNPLSFMITRLRGYAAGKDRKTNITHNFFVDDLKLYNSTMNGVKKQLDLVTRFSQDIGMKFGQDKCAHLVIEKGQIKNNGQHLEMNGVKIQQVDEGECYKYLGQDENISYVGAVNKERVSKEYFNRVRKIWKSKLSAFNKTIAHNMFAVPVLTPTYGVLDWTIQEITNIDIKTRKILSMAGNFHINSDVDCLYIPRSEGGKGLKAIQTAYECRIVSLNHHLSRNKYRNKLLSIVSQSEENESARVAGELCGKYDITTSQNELPRSVGQKYLRSKYKENTSLYQNKVMHGYIAKSIENNPKIDQKTSKSWTRNEDMSSEFEAYAFAIKDQEIATKYIKTKRQKGNTSNTITDTRCRLCKSANEDIIHIIASCPIMSVRYYLPLRHDVIAKIVYNAFIHKKNPSYRIRDLDSPEYIHKEGNLEYWWNISIKTATKIPHNKPGLILWDRDEKICQIIEFSCPADINVSSKIEEKVATYGPLVRNLQIMYKDYRFKMLPVVVGALGTIPNATKESLKEMKFSKIEINKLLRKLQNNSVRGTVKICKTFMKFSES